MIIASQSLGSGWLSIDNMKYQALKKLKTKTKVLKICDTLQEAHDIIKAEGAKFHSFSYIGGFPIYEVEKESGRNYYNIQGLHETLNIVLGLNKDELSDFNFNQ